MGPAKKQSRRLRFNAASLAYVCVCKQGGKNPIVRDSKLCEGRFVVFIAPLSLLYLRRRSPAHSSAAGGHKLADVNHAPADDSRAPATALTPGRTAPNPPPPGAAAAARRANTRLATAAVRSPESDRRCLAAVMVVVVHGSWGGVVGLGVVRARRALSARSAAPTPIPRAAPPPAPGTARAGPTP